MELHSTLLECTRIFDTEDHRPSDSEDRPVSFPRVHPICHLVMFSYGDAPKNMCCDRQRALEELKQK